MREIKTKKGMEIWTWHDYDNMQRMECLVQCAIINYGMCLKIMTVILQWWILRGTLEIKINWFKVEWNRKGSGTWTRKNCGKLLIIAAKFIKNFHKNHHRSFPSSQKKTFHSFKRNLIENPRHPSTNILCSTHHNH